MLGPGLAPAFWLHPGAQLQSQRLAIGQGQAGVETLATGAGLEGQADVGQGQRRMVQRLQGDLTVEHRQAADHLHLIEQLRGIQRFVLLHRHTFQRPLAVGAFLEAELEAVELEVFDTHRARQQAAPKIRNHAYMLQMQGIGALTHGHVMSQQLPKNVVNQTAHRYKVIANLVFNYEGW